MTDSSIDFSGFSLMGNGQDVNVRMGIGKDLILLSKCVNIAWLHTNVFP